MMHQIMLQFLADIKCTNKTVRRQYILNKVFKIIQIRYQHQHIFETSRNGALGGSETLTSKLKAFDYLSLTFIWNNVACL